jgi:hypothetical protein
MGRDFQTFVTYIRDELGPHGGFAALASDGPVAFACTLQTKGVPTKIRKDLKKIAAGPKVDRVYALLASDLASGKAAELKQEAREQHDLTLEILDGQAIADLLSAHDTFWIAARWLAVPAEYAPEPPETPSGPEWYLESRQRWQEAERDVWTMGDLLDVRAGLRRATFHRDARPDLGMWLALMSRATEEDRPPGLRQRARYEVAVAQLRGAGDLRPADGHVRAFMDDVDFDEATWADLLDASVLLQFVAGAALRGRTTFDGTWITDWNRGLRDGVEARLKHERLTLTQRAGLLDVLGHLRTHVDLDEVELPTSPTAAYDPLDHEVDGEWTPEPIPSSVPLVDADGAVTAWLKFARLAEKAPLVPVDSVSSLLALLAPALVDCRDYAELVRLMDDRLAEVAGSSAAAERSRDRAFAFLRQNRPLDALADLHEAKVRWWQGDTLRGSLLALLTLARCYERLRLYLAAKQHALVAVGMAGAHGNDEHGDLIAAGLMLAARLDYRSGAWCSASESYEVAMMAHVLYEDDPWDISRHTELEAAYLHGGYMRAAAMLVNSGLATTVKKGQDEVGLGDVLEETSDLMPDWTPDQWREAIVEQMDTVPFADAGPDRVIEWSALGLRWEIRAVNTYSHCRAAERFAAAAQVLCAELAREDLVLLPTSVRVTVQARDREQTAGHDRVRREPGNDASKWIIDLLPLTGDGSELDGEEVTTELLVALTRVLYDASLARWNTHEQVIERAYSRGLIHKIAAGRPYDDVASVVPRPRFDATDRVNVSVPVSWRARVVAPPVPDLEWPKVPGPGYTTRESLQMIRNRYTRTREILPFTLARLGQDPEFLRTYARLLAQGWKDWHVSLALVNARINYRLAKRAPSSDELKELMKRQPQHPSETASEDPLPREFLSIDYLTNMRRMGFVTGLKYWDLELHQQTPDFDAIERLLCERYGYGSDDVPHEPLFGENAD